LSVSADTDAALLLLSAAAVRERANLLLHKGLDGELAHFRIDLHRLESAADHTIEVTKAAYPDLDIPFHSRWRHFVLDGQDRWAHLAGASGWRDSAARARAEFDLAIISVLLDAGAGPDWRFRDAPTRREIGRSEGLALASLAMFAGGAFSGHPGDPLRADARTLERLADETLTAGFQVSDANPLPGIAGRADLLRRLGRSVAASPAIFATEDEPRPGGLFDHLASLAADDRIEAATILRELLIHLGPIWPSRIALGGIPLGDCWRHPALRIDDATNRLMPLHKLSQWLAYSLIEPMQRAGMAVTAIDGLTGLAEYRNGGLFIDSGALAFRDAEDARRRHEVSAPLVVEWRALTVALLDRLAGLVRLRLQRDAHDLPLARILQGGTWAAGRMLARRLRPDGAPPVAVISDGTVF
jgi:Protein of unknown function (DUF1688)